MLVLRQLDVCLLCLRDKKLTVGYNTVCLAVLSHLSQLG